jgi:hypothetical protein
VQKNITFFTHRPAQNKTMPEKKKHQYITVHTMFCSPHKKPEKWKEIRDKEREENRE